MPWLFRKSFDPFLVRALLPATLRLVLSEKRVLGHYLSRATIRQPLQNTTPHRSVCAFRQGGLEPCGTENTPFTRLYAVVAQSEQRVAMRGRHAHFIETNEPIQEWINVPVLPEDPHAIVGNAGDLIQRWTNDYWVSDMHRVVWTTRNSSSDVQKPLSSVFFTGPALETIIEKLLPSPLLEHQESKYRFDAVTVGEHLKMKIAPTSTTSE